MSENSYGKLYLVATPIGNLGDMTFRAVEILKSVSVIAAEDTRNSIKLLNHFDIHTPMMAYHDHNRFEGAVKIIERLKNGEEIACITDAGTPGISDPGEELVKMAAEEEIQVIPIPGASAGISGLIVSGLSTRRFRFEGFLPNDKKERKALLEELKEDTATLIFHEAPHHLLKTAEELLQVFGNRKISLCKELTKVHEEIIRTDLSSVSSLYSSENPPKGEFVLVMEGRSREKKEEEKRKIWEEMTLEEHLNYYLNCGFEKKEAMKKVAEDRGIQKREVYQATQKKEK